MTTPEARAALALIAQQMRDAIARPHGGVVEVHVCVSLDRLTRWADALEHEIGDGHV